MIPTGTSPGPVEDIRDLQRVILELEAGDVVTLRGWREGRERTVRVSLQVVPAEGG